MWIAIFYVLDKIKADNSGEKVSRSCAGSYWKKKVVFGLFRGESSINKMFGNI